MNNKGQVLVIFVILLPILLMLFTLVVEVGLLSIEKRKIDNNTYDAIEYYLKSNDKEKTINILKENLDDIDIEINSKENYVEMIVTKEYKNLYTILSNNNKIIITYKGIKETKEIIKG